MTGVFFLWLYRRSRPAFRIFRNGFLASTAIALVVHRFFPTAPPRLADVGLVHPGFGLAGLSNPVAAMPSLHAGWALGVGIGVVRYARPLWWRVAGALYPPAVVLTIVATGNHFFLDAFAGMAVLGLGFGLASALTRGRVRVPQTNRVSMRASLFAAAIGVMVTAALGGSSIVSAHRAAPTSVELTQMLGKGDTLQVVLSEAGASATETRGDSRTGVIVRYDDGQMFSLDYGNHAFMSQTIDAAVADLKRERTQIDKMQIEVPARDGSHSPGLRSPTLTPLELTAKIAGLPAHAYLLHQQGDKTPVRLWLADDLPAPPAGIQAAVVGAISLPITSGRVLLRTEIQVGKRWVTGLDTTSSREVAVTKETLAPPAGWRRVATPKVRKPASVPARPLRWFGPSSANPDVFARLSNGPFSTTFTGSMNSLLSVWSVVAPRSVLDLQVWRWPWTFPRLEPDHLSAPITSGRGTSSSSRMVTQSALPPAAPKIWWHSSRSDHRDHGSVDPGHLQRVGGYHMVNLARAAASVAVSLAAHPEMPWFIVKASPLGSVPDGTTTGTASHELVETATDPLPLSANIDYTKSPPWTGGELADICSVGSPLTISTVFRFGATLAAYWSNASGACVG